jgi:hypothetical protein
MTTSPLPHSVSGGAVVVSVGLGLEVVELGELVVVSVGLGELVVELGLSPPGDIQPLATTLRTKTPTKSRANSPFFIPLSPALILGDIVSSTVIYISCASLIRVAGRAHS